METPAIFKLPPLPNIIRARCPDVQPRRGGYFSYMQPLDWSNYLASYLWNFNISLSNFFPYMFFDMKYGYILFRTATPDYGWSFSSYSFPAYTYLPGGELTYNSAGLKINVNGTEYSKTPWDSDITEYTFTGQTKDDELYKVVSMERIEEKTWAELLDELVAESLALRGNTRTNIDIYFEWYYQASPSGESDYDKWLIRKHRGYLSFDTSSLSGKTIVSVTLKIYIRGLRPPAGGAGQTWESETTNMLHVYDQDWGTLATDDWSGGSSVGSADVDDLTKDEYNEITLSTSVINADGETQLKLAWLGDIDDYAPNDPYTYNGGLDPSDIVFVGGGAINIASGDATENKPTLVVEATG